MVDFAGFEMPIHYGSILQEHRAVREQAGLFDVSHMGQIHFSGPRASEALERLLTCPVASLRIGRARYGLQAATGEGEQDLIQAAIARAQAKKAGRQASEAAASSADPAQAAIEKAKAAQAAIEQAGAQRAAAAAASPLSPREQLQKNHEAVEKRLQTVTSKLAEAEQEGSDTVAALQMSILKLRAKKLQIESDLQDLGD